MKLIETQLGGMAAPSGLHDTRERPNDQLTEEMIAAVPLDAPLIAEDEEKLERLRTAVVVKTYSKLMHLYNVRPNAENDERMLRRVKAFSKALFKNMAWNGHHTRCEPYVGQSAAPSPLCVLLTPVVPVLPSFFPAISQGNT